MKKGPVWAEPSRRSAWQKVKLALVSGALKREPCLMCGATKVEGHHADYNEPLSVVWLCRKHHVEAHMIARYHPTLTDAVKVNGRWVYTFA